jgi:malate dehydrogenase
MKGEYGYSDIVSGVPAMIGAAGAEKIIEMTLKTLQKERFKNSVASVQDMIDILEEQNFFDDKEENKKS